MSIAVTKAFSIKVDPSDIPTPTAYWEFEEASGSRIDSINGVALVPSESNLGSILQQGGKIEYGVGFATAKGVLIGTVTPDIFSSTVSFFNSGMPLAHGVYTLFYDNGALKYNIGQGWALNGGGVQIYLLRVNGTDYFVGGTLSTTFPNQAAVEAANLNVNLPHDLPVGGTIGVWLTDDSYPDNISGTPNPTFSLYKGSSVSGISDLTSPTVSALAMGNKGWSAAFWVNLSQADAGSSMEVIWEDGASNSEFDIAVNVDGTLGHSQALGVDIFDDFGAEYLQSKHYHNTIGRVVFCGRIFLSVGPSDRVVQQRYSSECKHGTNYVWVRNWKPCGGNLILGIGLWDCH